MFVNSVYTKQLQQGQSNISDKEVDAKLENEFASWFNEFVRFSHPIYIQ